MRYREVYQWPGRCLEVLETHILEDEYGEQVEIEVGDLITFSGTLQRGGESMAHIPGVSWNPREGWIESPKDVDWI